MTGSRPEDNNSTPDEELDPTGVRDLLANLPDPGPMPEHLAARISRSLQLEQERRVGGAGSPMGQGQHEVAGPAPISLAERRERRRPGRNLAWLGSAAAVAVAATVVTTQLLGGSGDSDMAAQYPSASDNAADNGADGAEAGSGAQEGTGAGDKAGPGDVADAAPPVSEPQDGALPEDSEAGAEEGMADYEPPLSAWPGRGDGDDAGVEASSNLTVHTVTGTVHLTEDGLAAEVRDWSQAAVPGDTSWTAEQVTVCIAESGVDSSGMTDVLASEAYLDGADGLLLVSTDADPVAMVLDDNCSRVLSGPVRLD